MKKSNDLNIFERIKYILNNITLKTDNTGSYIFGFSGISESDSSIENKSNKEPENSNIEFNKNVPDTNNKSNKDGSSYNNYEYNDYSRKQKEMPSAPQGVIDSITHELTSVRLQQAIILSEIVGKPKSKTRKRRRF